MKRQNTDLNKIFVIDTSFKGHVSKMCKEFQKIDNKTINLLKIDKRLKTSLKEICAYQISACKCAQHHQPLDKCKLKSQ